MRSGQFPDEWHELLAGYGGAAHKGGLSGALLFRLSALGRDTLFAKFEPRGGDDVLLGEASRLRWLGEQGVECPEVLAQESGQEGAWLLMTAVSGRSLEDSSDLPPERFVEIAAAGLRRLHRLDVGACPFDDRLHVRVAAASRRVAAGLVDEDDFDDERLGRSAADLLRELRSRKPAHEDLVVAHGDASLGNIIAADGAFSGLVDCGRLGVADRFQDLALVSRDIAGRFGDAGAALFFELCGIGADDDRLAYYRLLDEFF